MQVVFGILLMFSSAASGSLIRDPENCTFNRNNLNNQCYVALGHRLHLQIPLKEEENRFHLKFTDKTTKDHLILKYSKNQNNSAPNPPRWQFVNDNNTMILTSAERSDSGNYSLEIHAEGTFKGKYSLHLNTEAQVSSVKVWYSCLSPGVMKVFCSANGDNLHFNWTSHVNPVPQLEDGNSTLILNKTQHGEVTCHVENHVSRDNNTMNLPPCPEPTTSTSSTVTPSTTKPHGTNSTVIYNESNTPNQTCTTSHGQNKSKELLVKVLLYTMSSVCLSLIIVSILACYVYKKKQRRKDNEVTSQDRELVYAQVTHLPMNSTEARPRKSQAQDDNVEYATVVSQTSKTKKKKNEDEVQYGEVVFNTHAKRKHNTPKEQDDCVYSQVQHIH